MELVLKLPTGKPPFIGILFPDDQKGPLLNADLVNDHKNKRFRIFIEHYEKTLNLRLACDELVSVRFYDNLRYDPEKLRSWLYLTAKSSRFNFGHLWKKNEREILLTTSPGNNKFVLSIQKVEFFVPKDWHVAPLPY